MDEHVDTGFNEEQHSDEIVTLSDVVETEQQLLADACAVLGACDSKNCTYSEGYLKRQALYACLTCVPEARTDVTKRAGICLACTFHCHDGHDLVELYTKRNFRCDCGNTKFPPETTCNLNSNKDAINDLNIYNQNFSGVYCVCHRPYPDPDDSVGDEMIQCIVCEDWFHSRHLGVELPSVYQEMICVSCIKKHEFLLRYEGLFVSKVTNEESDANKVDVDVSMKEEISTSDLLNKILNEKCESIVGEINKGKNEDKNKPLANGGDQIRNPDCKMPRIKSDNVSAKFAKEMTWRQQLCTCESCMKMYETQNVSFLIDLQDTMQVYEEKGKALAMENEMRALNSIPRVPLLEAIAGYNDMKEQLIEYLKKFADNKKVVREEDIREFFSSMDARKKQRTTIPYFCR